MFRHAVDGLISNWIDFNEPMQTGQRTHRRKIKTESEVIPNTRNKVSKGKT